MAGNAMTLEFAGDATKLQAAAKKATAATEAVGAAAKSAGDDMVKASKQGVDYGEKIGNIGAGVTGMTDAVDAAGASVQALADIQSAGAARAQKLNRALNDVKQAQEDYNQALRDGKQASIDSGQAEIDLEQARLDQATTLTAYNEAVKEHGKNSAEALQAQIDMKQAGQDVAQAQEDAAQFTRDAAQATIDAEAAQLDLNDAMTEANPSGLQKWADNIQMITPLLTAVVGVVGLVTAAQWAWNAAQLASPTTWIILAIVALVAIIVLIATKTTWFQTLWKKAWGGIKAAASATWDFLKNIPKWTGDAFAKVAGMISKPYRAAFNFISDAWNHTIGGLSWSVPGWVPVIGGNSITVPYLPKFHSGGTVPGVPGTEVPILAMGGETVSSGGGGDMVHVILRIDSDTLIEATAKGVRRRGGNAQRVLGGSNA